MRGESGPTWRNLRFGVLAALAALATLAALAGAAPAYAQGLPRTYNPAIVDSPNPVGGGAFGWGIASADVTGDGELDLLVAQSQTGPGQIFIFNGVTGAHVDTINPPEQNPDGAAQQPVLGFTYVETMPDVGSCPGADGADADRICDAATVGSPDGIPEIIVGSRNLRVNASDPSAAPTTGDPRLGRGYIFDGATRAVLKRIDMPPADRAAQVNIASSVGSPPPGVGSIGTQFGRVMMNPSGLEPCAGARGENNNFGVSPCPTKPLSERIGDLNGDNVADIVITARSFVERTGPVDPAIAPEEFAAPDSQCRNVAPGRTCTSGKAWTYSGAIAGTDPRAILDTPIRSIQNPRAQTGGAEFGGNMSRVGDICIPGPQQTCPTDGKPEFVIPARNLDYPLANPDPGAGNPGENIGASFLFNGATGGLIRIVPSPEPQPRSQFGGGFNSGRPVGDLGATSTPDFIQAAPLQNALSTDDGRAWVFNGDLAAGGGGEQSWNFATLTDPNPAIGGTFGGSLTGVGDLVSGPDAPANEILIAGFAFDTFTEASANLVGDLHIMNPTLQKELQRIPHPEANGPSGGRGDGFGVGLTPMGDLNDDGFLDFAASAYFTNLQFGGQGRAYIFKSDNSPLPTQPPSPPPPAGAAPIAPRLLRAGRCTNQTLGTEGADRLEGTLAGDMIFAFGGDDAVDAFQGEDCVQGGSGDDVLKGQSDNDKLIGDGGNDNLNGGDGRDDLRGGAGRDRLSGGFGRDFLAGGSGADRIFGGADPDRIFGEGGNDRISTGDGRNRVDGGRGNDVISARNGERDVINCGSGRDRVRADRGDRVGRSCERVSRGSARRRRR